MPLPQFPFASPLDEPVLNSGWFAKRGKSLHEGLDFAGDRMKVYAIAGGTVYASKYVTDGGNLIIIHHDEPPFVGFSSRYCHLHKRLVQTTTRVGSERIPTRVQKGQTIAISGNTGSVSQGAHLHLDVQAVQEVLASILPKLGRKALGRRPAPGGVGRNVPGEVLFNYTPRMFGDRRGVSGEFIPPPPEALSLGPNWDAILASAETPEAASAVLGDTSAALSPEAIQVIREWWTTQRPQYDPLSLERGDGALGSGPTPGEMFAAGFVGTAIVGATIAFIRR